MSFPALLASGILLFTACGGEGAKGASIDASTDPEDASIPDPSEFVFEPEQIRTYRLTVDPDDWAAIYADPRAEEYVGATLDFEGEQYEQVAIRYKGSASTLRNCVSEDGIRECDKLSLKLKFSEYDETKRFFGLKRLNFNSYVRDPSLLRERLAYSLFEDMGIATPRAAFARLVVNDEDLGVFGLVEQVDGRFTRRHFPEEGGEGNLYKETWPVYTDEYFFLEGLKTNRSESPSADRMVRLSQALLGASDEEFVATLGAWMDVDQLMTHVAIDRAIDHPDGILTFYCWDEGHWNHNFYWYAHENEDRVQLIPWDFDQSLQTPNPIRNVGVPEWTVLPNPPGSCPTFVNDQVALPGCDPLVARFSTLLWERFVQRSQALLAGPFAIAPMHQKIDAWAQTLASEVETDATLDAAAWAEDVAALKDDLVGLRSRFEAELLGP